MPGRGRPPKKRKYFGIYLAQLRENAGFSVTAAAKASKLDKAYLSRLELSGKIPSPGVLKKLARAYKIPEGKVLTHAAYLQLPLEYGIEEPSLIPDSVLSEINDVEKLELKRYLAFLRMRTFVRQEMFTRSQ